MTKKSVRLSKTVVPIKYQITLKPDLEAFVFEGEEIILVELKRSAKGITLHAADLNIKSAEFIHKKNQTWAGRVFYNQKAETAEIIFDKKLPKGPGELKLIFRGILNDKMIGFYRSAYKNHNGKTKHLATTQFEATDARRAFPCFDEPTQKAVFEVSLIVPNNQEAISNTLPIEIWEHSAGYKTVRFAPTPKMSTYLLAFITGEFDYLEGKTKHGVKVRVFTTPGKRNQGRFALNTAIKMLEFYNWYFGVKYPLNTLDLIAIPDFSHGAMENWGAVTYRETALLVDEEHSSAQSKQYVALVIAHELAHQWFGNLVTMEWWTHLWLNEGFASFIEYLAVDNAFPAWDIWTQFAYFDQDVAFHLDSFKNTHPIEIEVRHPREIGEIFDAISYSKGASVIKMLHNYLGDKNFRDGLKYYLKTFAYKNAATKHLWEAFEKISGKPVRKVMRNWTKKSGYPIVKFSLRNSRLKIEQERFYLSPVSKQQNNDKTLWQIPIDLTINGVKSPKILLEKKYKVVDIKSNPKWIKANIGETGFYRTDYSPELLRQLSLKIHTLQPLDRMGVVRDAFALTFSGHNFATEALELAEKYKEEKDYTVWVKLISGLGEFGQLLSNEKIYFNYKRYCVSLLKSPHKLTGWLGKKNEPHTQNLLRSLILRQLGGFGDKAVIDHAKKLFYAHLKGKNRLSADLRGAVYGIVSENASEKEFNSLVKLYNKTDLQEEQRRIMGALAQFKQINLINKALKFAFSDKVRPQDSPLMLSTIAANPRARKQAWNFVKNNWTILKDRYAQGGHMLNRII